MQRIICYALHFINMLLNADSKDITVLLVSNAFLHWIELNLRAWHPFSFIGYIALHLQYSIALHHIDLHKFAFRCDVGNIVECRREEGRGGLELHSATEGNPGHPVPTQFTLHSMSHLSQIYS